MAYDLRKTAEEFYRDYGMSIRREAAKRVLLALVADHNQKEPQDQLRAPNPQSRRGARRIEEQAELDSLLDRLIQLAKYHQPITKAIKAILAERGIWTGP